MLTLICNLGSTACVIGAIHLMTLQLDGWGWGWLLFAAWVLHVNVSLKIRGSKDD